MEVMADRTERRFTRDLIFEAVPFRGCQRIVGLELGGIARLTNSSANILAARETWSFGAVETWSVLYSARAGGREQVRTDDEGNHARAITTGGLEAFDELLDLPYLDLYKKVSGLELDRGTWHVRREIKMRHEDAISTSHLVVSWRTYVLLGLVSLSVTHFGLLGKEAI